MSIFIDDLDYLFSDFKVAVSTESFDGFGVFDKTDGSVGAFTDSADYELTVKTSEFSSVSFGDTITVAGENYEVKDARRIDEGLLSVISLSKI